MGAEFHFKQGGAAMNHAIHRKRIGKPSQWTFSASFVGGRGKAAEGGPACRNIVVGYGLG
jgi:hypothetical protein